MSTDTQAAEPDPAFGPSDEPIANQPGVHSADLAADPTPAPLTGYELVEDMMRRQDDVIAELDSLNRRIENAIEEISAARKLELGEPPTEEANDEPVSTEPLPLKQAA